MSKRDIIIDDAISQVISGKLIPTLEEYVEEKIENKAQDFFSEKFMSYMCCWKYLGK